MALFSNSTNDDKNTTSVGPDNASVLFILGVGGRKHPQHSSGPSSTVVSLSPGGSLMCSRSRAEIPRLKAKGRNGTTLTQVIKNTA